MYACTVYAILHASKIFPHNCDLIFSVFNRCQSSALSAIILAFYCSMHNRHFCCYYCCAAVVCIVVVLLLWNNYFAAHLAQLLNNHIRSRSRVSVLFSLD